MDQKHDHPLPNPAQLRAMAHPAHEPRPCVPGRHCERHARNLGGCIAGECNPPAPAGVTAAPAPKPREDKFGDPISPYYPGNRNKGGTDGR